MRQLTGFQLVGNPILIEREHIGTWLNSYKPSKHRSKRLIKKLTRGQKYKRSLTEPIFITVPKKEVIRLGNMIIGHPEIINRLKEECKSNQEKGIGDE